MSPLLRATFRDPYVLSLVTVFAVAIGAIVYIAVHH